MTAIDNALVLELIGNVHDYINDGSYDSASYPEIPAAVAQSRAINQNLFSLACRQLWIDNTIPSGTPAAEEALARCLRWLWGINPPADARPLLSPASPPRPDDHQGLDCVQAMLQAFAGVVIARSGFAGLAVDPGPRTDPSVYLLLLAARAVQLALEQKSRNDTMQALLNKWFPHGRSEIGIALAIADGVLPPHAMDSEPRYRPADRPDLWPPFPGWP